MGVLIIVWQMGKQHRNSLELQKENFREELRLNIYKELGDKLEDTSSAFQKVGMYVFMLPMSIKSFKRKVDQGLKPSPMKERAEEFSQLHFKAKNSMVELFRMFEKYQIVNPNFSIFQLALTAASYDVDQTLSKLHLELLKYLPTDVDPDRVREVGTKVIVPSMPNDDQLKTLEELINAYWDATSNVLSYLIDLRIDAQNILLGKLFENKVSPRRPLDPKRIVISTEPDKIKELESYFEKNTAWGKYKQRIESTAPQNIKDKASST
jgi:hypothetical protein